MNFPVFDKNIEKIEIEDGIKEIPDYAFSSFLNLKEVIIAPTVKNIGKGAFQNCKSLQKVVLPEGILELNNNLFLNCKKLENINIPNSVLKIGDQTFFGTNIKNVKIPKNVVTIGNGAFTGTSEFTIYDDFNYSVNKYNIFTWLSEPVYERETDGTIPLMYDFIKNVVVTIIDNNTELVKFRFFIPFRDKFDFFSITHELFVNNKLDLALLDREFQLIRDFENKTKYVYYRMSYPYKLSDENLQKFARFFKLNDVKIAESFIDANLVEPFVKLEKLEFVNDTNIDKLIEYANFNSKFNSLSYLMNFKNEHFKNRFEL